MRHIRLYEDFGPRDRKIDPEMLKKLKERNEKIATEIKAFIESGDQMLLVYGGPGTGKTAVTEAILKDRVGTESIVFVNGLSDAEDIEMAVTQLGTKVPNRILFVGDSDELVKDAECVNILKALADGGRATILDEHGKREIILGKGDKMVLIVTAKPPRELIDRTMSIDMDNIKTTK